MNDPLYDPPAPGPEKLYEYGKPCSIKDCPPGIFKYGENYFLKTDYFGKGNFEIFRLGDGEYAEKEEFPNPVQPCMLRCDIIEKERIEAEIEGIKEAFEKKGIK